MNPNNNYNSKRAVARRRKTLEEQRHRVDVYERLHEEWFLKLRRCRSRLWELEMRIETWTPDDAKEFEALQRTILEADWRQR